MKCLIIEGFCGRARSTTTAISSNNKNQPSKQVAENKTPVETQRILLNPSVLGFSSFNRQTSFYKAIKAFDPKFSHIATQGGSQGIDGHGTIDTSAAVIRKSSKRGRIFALIKKNNLGGFQPKKKSRIHGADKGCSQM